MLRKRGLAVQDLTEEEYRQVELQVLALRKFVEPYIRFIAVAAAILVVLVFLLAILPAIALY
jgi:hypothetical protein